MTSSAISHQCRNSVSRRYCRQNNNTDGRRFTWHTSNNKVGVASPKTTALPSSRPTPSTTTIRWNSNTSSNMKHQQQSYQEYMIEANNTMLQYHQTRELMKQGKLVPKNGINGSSKSSSNTLYIQGGVVATFLVVFLSMPKLGKKIATDEEFRRRFSKTTRAARRPHQLAFSRHHL